MIAKGGCTLNNFSSSGQRKYSTNIFISIMLTVAITIFALSAILYYRFEKIATSLIYGSTKENLIQVSHSVEYMKETAKSAALQIYYDAEISNLMFLPSPTQQEVLAALKKLDSFRFSNTSFIESIYVYSRLSGSVYTSASSNSMPVADLNHFYDKEIGDIVNHSQKFTNMEFIPRKIPIPIIRKDSPQIIDGYSFIYYDSVTADALNSAVILNVSEQWLNNTVNSLNANHKQNTLVIDGNGIALTNSGSYQMLTDIHDKPYIRKILDSSEQANYFTDKVDGVKSLVTFVKMKQTGWTFVMTIPYENIVGKITETRNHTIVIGFVILLLGLLTSFVISKRIYKPIAATLGKIDALVKENRENTSKQRQDYLLSLLHGNTELDKEKIKKRFAAFGIGMTFEEPTFLLLLRIDHYACFISSYEYADRKILKYAISNIACELISGHWRCEGVDAGEDHVALIVSNTKNREQLERVIAHVQEMVRQHLNLSLSVTISTTSSSLEDLCNIYSEAIGYSNYRVFRGHGCVIDVGQTAANENQEYVYPINKEEILIQNLLIGKLPAVKEAYESIVSQAAESSYSAFSSALLRLFSSINYAIFSLSKDYPIINYDSARFSQRLGKFELEADITQLFFELFENVSNAIDAKKSLRSTDMINTIKEIVQTNYSSPDLCLNLIADKIGMNPVYLGRLFKKMTQMSVSEYINDCRMELAREMLTNNTATIGEIAEQIGIMNKSHFYTLFKKQFGKTPNDFRNSIRQEQGVTS